MARPKSLDPQILDAVLEGLKFQKQRLDQYNQIKQQAGTFYIPVLSYERFLYFIGYKVESTRPGAF